MKIKISRGRRIYNILSTVFLTALCVIMMMPLLKVVAESFSGRTFIENNEVLFWPKGFNLDAYKSIFSNPRIMTAFKNSVFITVVGTLVNLLMTALLAYPLSRPEFAFKKPLLLMITITMILSAPMIPSYLLIKEIGLDNTLWAVIIPGAVSGYNFHIMRSFFMGIPGELIDSARIDGCNEMGILFKIVLPLSKAVMATLTLFYGVSHWNSLQQPLIYLRNANMHTLQIILYKILQDDVVDMLGTAGVTISPVTTKMATIVVATVPILVVYPFLQKHFAQGATLGSVKE